MNGDAPPLADARAPVDVYKAGRLAARMWRVTDVVTFAYTEEYVAVGGPAVAFTLPVSRTSVETARMQLPAFFAGLLPEGETRRRELQRAFHLAEDDELGLLAVVGADMVGDVQVVPAGDQLPSDLDEAISTPDWSTVSFQELWQQIPGPRSRSSLPGVQPKMSAQSRSLQGTLAGPVILKFPISGWHGVLANEAFFMSGAAEVGLSAALAAVVVDRDGQAALQVTRFDRSVDDGRLARHAQEDASQVLGLRPGQKYDPDARTVVGALAGHCASPKLAARNLFHQLVYSYAIGNNDVHAKNLSILRPPGGLWSVTPVYDVLHTWPYEGNHRFVPAVRPDGNRDAVTRKWWLALAADIDLPERAAERIINRVVAAIPALIEQAGHAVDLPGGRRRDLARVLRRRARDLQGG